MIDLLTRGDELAETRKGPGPDVPVQHRVQVINQHVLVALNVEIILVETEGVLYLTGDRVQAEHGQRGHPHQDDAEIACAAEQHSDGTTLKNRTKIPVDKGPQTLLSLQFKGVPLCMLDL